MRDRFGLLCVVPLVAVMVAACAPSSADSNAAGRPALAAGYAVGTTLAGLGAVAVAIVLTRAAVRSRAVRSRRVR